MNNNDYVVAKDIDFFYGKRHILKNVTLSMKQGEIYGLVGPNGAGKTTLLKIMSGLTKPKNGSVKIEDDIICQKKVKVYEKIGVQIEDTASYENLSGYENMEILMNMYDINPKKIKENIMEILSLVGLKNSAYNKVKTYSLGMKKRLGIAMALINEPKFIILDEPTNGLDIDGIRLVREIVKKYSEKTHASVLISSHITSELENTCDNIAFLIDGKIKSIRRIEEFKNESIEEYYIKLKENHND